MRKEEVKGMFDVLKHLNKFHNNYKDIIKDREILGIKDTNLIYDICDELIKNKLVEKHNKKWNLSINRKGKRVITKYNYYSSFSFFLSSQRIIQKLKNNIKIILMFIGIISSIVFAYLNYIKTD
jgi:hypothetical protein